MPHRAWCLEWHEASYACVVLVLVVYFLLSYIYQHSHAHFSCVLTHANVWESMGKLCSCTQSSHLSVRSSWNMLHFGKHFASEVPIFSAAISCRKIVVKKLAMRCKYELHIQKSIATNSIQILQLVFLLFSTYYIATVLTPKFTTSPLLSSFLSSPLLPLPLLSFPLLSFPLLSSPVTQTAWLQGAEGVCHTAEALPWRPASGRILIKVKGSLWTAAKLSHSWLVGRGGRERGERKGEGEEGKERRG